MTKDKIKLQVSLDTFEMDQNLTDSIPATFYRWFHIGTTRYAVFKQDESFSIMKCVEHDGNPELHDIESESEFELIREYFLELEGKSSRLNN